MIHVSDVTAALTWYARAFPQAKRKTLAMPTFEFEYLDIDGVMLELVPADEKISSGASGSVVYWKVPDFDRALYIFNPSELRSIAGRVRLRTANTCARCKTAGAIASDCAGKCDAWATSCPPYQSGSS